MKEKREGDKGKKERRGMRERGGVKENIER